ncbi:MAG: response regulator [Gemmatales bacterium]
MFPSRTSAMKFAVDENSASEVLTESTHQLFYCPTDVKILIIDDESAICQVIERALSQPHFAIDSVSQHDKIDDALKKGSYSLIIMDYVLPGIDPNALFEKVKQSQPDAAVIVMTGYPSVDRRAKQFACSGL